MNIIRRSVPLEFKRRLVCLKYFSSKWSTVKPVDLSYTSYESTDAELSNAPTLIVHHGLFGSKTNWNSICKVYEKLAIPRRRIVAIDARNHGNSPHSDQHTYRHLVADLHKLITDELRLDRVALLGHSMGGRTVMLFALNHPEMVERLIVVDIAPRSGATNNDPIDSLLYLIGAMENVKLIQGAPMSVVRASADQQLSPIVPHAQVRSFLLTNLVESGTRQYRWRINLNGLKQNFGEIQRFPIEAQDGAPQSSSQYHGPALFIGGSESDYMRESDHTEIRNFFPNAEIQYVDGAGHWLHSEKPQEFIRFTLDFINRV